MKIYMIFAERKKKKREDEINLISTRHGVIQLLFMLRTLKARKCSPCDSCGLAQDEASNLLPGRSDRAALT